MGEVKGLPAPPWSDLPSELLGLVFLRLPTRTDRAFFPAVCRTWCFAARQCRLPPPSPVPWFLCPDGTATSFPCGETFQLPDSMHYHNSFGDWVLMSRNDGSCMLMNHFTKATMPLPSLSSYTYYEEPVEGFNNYSFPPPRLGLWLYNKNKGEIFVASLVVCSTRLIAAIVTAGSVGTIGLCRPGAAAWSVSAHDGCRYLSDMAFLEGKIYAIDRTAGLVLIAMDIVDEYDNEPRVSRIKYLIGGFPSRSICQGQLSVPYILESHGALLMVCKILSYKIEHTKIIVTGVSKLEVFKANLEHHLWTEMRTLGNDRALFLGRGCSRSVHVSPYDLSRDCIFFLNDSINLFSNSKKLATSCELYDMKDEKIYSPLPMVSWKREKVLATWIFSHGEADKASVSRSQEIVEPEVEPTMLICGGSCSAGASTTPH